MDFNGNDVSGFSGDVKFDDVCTTNLTASKINVGLCSLPPLFTLPTIAPPSGNPGSRVVMTALSSSLVFRIPSCTFKWYIHDAVGVFHNVYVPIAAGDYDLVADIFPVIEATFQAVLAPLPYSGDYTCTFTGGGYFNLTLTNQVGIAETRMLSVALAPSNIYLGSSGNTSIFGNGTIQPLNIVVLTLGHDPSMNWEPYSLVDAPAVVNPMDSNLDANGFEVKKLSQTSYLQTGAPTLPAPGESVLYVNVAKNLEVLDDLGNTQILRSDEIKSTDGTAYIDVTTNTVTETAGTTITTLSTATPYYLMTVGATPRINIRSNASVIFAPGGLSQIQLGDLTCFFGNSVDIFGAGNVVFQVMDYVGASVNIGPVNATAVNIGRNAITTTIAGTAALTGNATVTGTLGVTGLTTMANAVATGTLGVTGLTSVGAITTTGLATLASGSVTGTLGVTGVTTANQITSFGNIVNYGMFVGGTTVSINNTATETVLLASPIGQLVITANTAVAGDTYYFRGGGNATNVSPTTRIRIRGGVGGITGTVLFDSGLLAFNVGDYSFEGNVTVRTAGASGSVVSNFTITSLTTSYAVDYQNITGVDTTVNNTISPTWQWSNTTGTMVRRNLYCNRVF